MQSDFSLFFGRFHPLLVHLPIGILLFAALLELLSTNRKNDHYDLATKIALLTGAFTAFLAALAGYFLSTSGAYEEKALFWHQWFGISIGFVALLAWWLKQRPGIKQKAYQAKANKWLAATVLLLIGVTGHLGGNLTHGSDYLTEYLPIQLSSWLGTEVSSTTSTPLPTQVDSIVVFTHVIQPILRDKCMRCHQSGNAQGQLRLDSEDGFRKGGKSGSLVSPGDWEKSELVRRVILPRSSSKFMPARNLPPLNPVEIHLLKWWISNGADFKKKVAATDANDQTKFLLTTYLGMDLDKKMPPPLPIVSKASPQAVQALKEAGLLAKPLSQETHLLEVSFLMVRNQSVEQRRHRLQTLLLVKDQLYWLNLSEFGLENADLKIINQLHHLTRLHLQKNNISDAGVPYLLKLNKLEYLNLYENPITDQSLSSFQKLPALKTINLWQTQITEKGIAGLKSYAKQLEVNY
ncbi:MAG: DUF2231 domain-containing protein [Bacteroidota bacterium]